MEFVQSSGSARRRLALHALETKQKGNKHQSTGSRRAAARIRAAPPPFFGGKGGGRGRGVLERADT